MLFKTSEKLREYANASEINYISVKNLLADIEEKHVKPLIGPEYTVLNAAYTTAADESELTALQQALLDKCRKVTGPYLCYYYTPLADGSLSDSGFKRSESDSLKTAYQYQLKNFRAANLQLAETASENLLGYMEENELNFPLWVASDEYKQYNSLFIKTAKEFNTLFPVETPYSIYRRCKTKMLDIEENEIRPLLGDALFDVLKARLLAGTLQPEDKVLLAKLKPAIAKLSIGFSMAALNVQIGSGGLSVISQSPRSKDDEIGERSNADLKAIEQLSRATIDSGRQWLRNATNYMLDNFLVFPTYPGNIVVAYVDSDVSGSFGLT